jgi:hypothetical protein
MVDRILPQQTRSDKPKKQRDYTMCSLCDNRTIAHYQINLTEEERVRINLCDEHEHMLEQNGPQFYFLLKRADEIEPLQRVQGE